MLVVGTEFGSISMISLGIYLVLNLNDAPVVVLVVVVVAAKSRILIICKIIAHIHHFIS